MTLGGSCHFAGCNPVFLSDRVNSLENIYTVIITHRDEPPSIYPLVNVYMTMERSTIFNGKTHSFYGHVQ